MTTLKQEETNRQNAQYSTGPRTPEGKARSSQNARKHNLYTIEEIVEGEDPETWQAYHDEWILYMQPPDIETYTLTVEIAHIGWRLRRVMPAENRLFWQALDDPDLKLGHELNKLSQHEARLLRELYRLLEVTKSLKRLRANEERMRRGEPAPNRGLPPGYVDSEELWEKIVAEAEAKKQAEAREAQTRQRTQAPAPAAKKISLKLRSPFDPPSGNGQNPHPESVSPPLGSFCNGASPEGPETAQSGAGHPASAPPRG